MARIVTLRRWRKGVTVAGRVTLLLRRRGKTSGIGDDSDCAADGASDRGSAWRELQRRPAVGTVDQDHRGR